MTTYESDQPPYDDYTPPDYGANGDGVNGYSRDDPQDAQAERAVLGGMLLSGNAIDDVVGRMQLSDFYRPAHRNIYGAVVDLYGRGEPADAVTVAAELDRRGQLRRIGGAPYLLDLISMVPSAVSAGYYANIVRDKAKLRALINTGTRLKQYGYSGAIDDDVAVTVSRAIGELTDIQDAAPQTTWTPINLGPYLDGDIEQPQPTIGIRRSDGQQLFYPGCDHAVIGTTESGKSWFVSGCAAAELRQNRYVLYVHHEEPDPLSTIERLRLLGVDDTLLDSRLDSCRFKFVGPVEPPNRAWVQALLDPPPALVIHDGVNEAIAMLGGETNTVESASVFRRQLVTPFVRVGAAVISCDHLPHNSDGARTAAMGTVHKGNTLSGSRILIQNKQPFGRGTRGMSDIYVTKDRPGYLRSSGKPTDVAGKTYMGRLVIDEATPEYMMFWAPSGDKAPTTTADDAVTQLADIMYNILVTQPGGQIASARQFMAVARLAGNQFTDGGARNAIEYLIAQGRIVDELGKRGSKGFKAVSTASDGGAQE